MGFEHSIVNMFLFPSGLLLGGDFTFGDYMLWNEIPTVVGNLVGGLLFVGLALYSTHIRTQPKINSPGPQAGPGPQADPAREVELVAR
jgi:formate/nitrite transporter FocA (FNT family)